MPTPTTEVNIVLNAHMTPPEEEARKQKERYFFFFGKKNKLKKIKKEEMQKRKKNYIQQGRIEISLKEHSGRADLQIPHYSPNGQSFREMALSVGH